LEIRTAIRTKEAPFLEITTPVVEIRSLGTRTTPTNRTAEIRSLGTRTTKTRASHLEEPRTTITPLAACSATKAIAAEVCLETHRTIRTILACLSEIIRTTKTRVVSSETNKARAREAYLEIRTKATCLGACLGTRPPTIPTHPGVCSATITTRITTKTKASRSAIRETRATAQAACSATRTTLRTKEACSATRETAAFLSETTIQTRVAYLDRTRTTTTKTRVASALGQTTTTRTVQGFRLEIQTTAQVSTITSNKVG